MEGKVFRLYKHIFFKKEIVVKSETKQPASNLPTNQTNPTNKTKTNLLMSL